MRAIFSNILICCNKENENKEIINNEINKNENLKKLKTSKSKNTNSNSKTTNVDSQKKYSFIISGLSIIDDRKKINKSINQNIKYENKNQNQNIIFPKYENNEDNNSNYNFSYSNNYEESEKNEIFKTSIFKYNNSKKSLISNIILDNSLTSQNSSCIRNLTEILNESKFKSKKSLTKIISRQTKPLLFDLSNEKKKNKNREVNLNFDNIILDKEIYSAPKLILSDNKNSNLFNGKIIKINASGCIEGLRQKRDGITIFGLKENKNENIINDIIVNLNEGTDNLINQLFAIFYDREKVHYYIQNLTNNIKNNKFIMCIKLYEYYINNNEKCFNYFLLGNTIISILILNDNSINIKIFENSINNKKYNEYKYEISDSPISIGRNNCLININNNHLSRIHCIILFDSHKNKWKIIDGNGKGKSSSHGTWFILSDNKFKLNYSNKYDVKIGKQFFNIKIENE